MPHCEGSYCFLSQQVLIVLTKYDINIEAFILRVLLICCRFKNVSSSFKWLCCLGWSIMLNYYLIYKIRLTWFLTTAAPTLFIIIKSLWILQYRLKIIFLTDKSIFERKKQVVLYKTCRYNYTLKQRVRFEIRMMTKIVNAMIIV
jgi:hypothetical protein